MRALLTLVVVLLLAAVPRAHVTDENRLVVRVYDMIGLMPRFVSHAVADAGRILRRANVDAKWRTCTRGDGGAPSCAAPDHGRALVIRLVRSPAEDPNPRALGRALIDPLTASGTLATVFVDRIEALARAGRADPARVTGRVIAHEIGHLLLGADTHTDSGLMRGLWTLKDLERDRPGDWQFSSAQLEQLRGTRPRT